MREITLTHPTLRVVALVDDIDYDYLMQWRWFAEVRILKSGRVHRRAKRRCAITKGTFYMHVVVARRAGISGEVDHRDADGFNNQRHNLRACTRVTNGANRRKGPLTASRFKGLTRASDCDRWKVRIGDGGRHYVGMFQSEEEAARAYNAAALRLYGEFASLNPV